MTEDTEQSATPSVRLFNKEDFNVDATRLVVEIYPAPDNTYFGNWYLELPHDDEDSVDIDEFYALRDAALAAYNQIELLLKMIEEQEDEP